MTWFALATLSALLSAAAAVTQKKVLFRITALEFSFLVSIVTFGFSLFVPFTVNVIAFPAPTLIILVGKSVLGGLAFLLVMMSLKHNQISSTLPLLGLTPGVAALLALLILGERLEHWEWMGIAFMMAGTYIVEKRMALGTYQPFRDLFVPRSQLYIAGAVILFATSSVFDRLLVGGLRIDPVVVLFYQHAVYCLMFGILILARRKPMVEILTNGRDQVGLIVFVSVLTLMYRFAQLQATQDAPVALVLAVKRTSILYASFFGGKLFSDDRLVRKLVGASIIVGAGFIILRNVS